MPLNDLQIATLVDKYIRERDRFEKMAGFVARRLSAELRSSAVPHVPTFRSKDPESLEAKLRFARDEHNFIDMEREFAPAIRDLAGVRIMLYRPEDEDATCARIDALYTVVHSEDHDDPDGYRARHRVVELPADVLGADSAMVNLAHVCCEVQVVTLPDHIWNELNHDIVYKTPAGQPSDEQRGLLGSLRGHLTGVRTTVALLMDATLRQKAGSLSIIDTAEQLRLALARRTGRPIDGNVAHLLRLLEGTLKELTPAALDRLPLSASSLTRANRRLQTAGVNNVDGVAVVIAALWEQLGPDFHKIASSWRGRPGPVRRCVEQLAGSLEQRTI